MTDIATIYYYASTSPSSTEAVYYAPVLYFVFLAVIVAIAMLTYLITYNTCKNGNR